MEYNVYEPCAELSKQVKTYWSLDGTAEESNGRERIFPDGCIEIIFNHRDRFRKYDSETDFHIQPPAFIHGQLKTYFELEPTGNVGIFSARLHPAGLRPFVNFDIDTFTGATLTFTDVWGDDGAKLEQALMACADNNQRVSALENFLLEKRDSLKVDNQPVEFCVDAIIDSVGAISIENVADNLGISQRQLERRFTAAVGISPKLFARITRFQNVLQLIENKAFKSFTATAYDGGFYDQAHFIKDFKDFTGLNPKQYFAENLEMVKHFTFEA
ncbi:MAG: DUF6597 domain-containing transcriptional factor [Flavobacterium sp.]